MATSAWRRGLVEGLFVLVSILLAFWIDAWWDHRQATQLEAQIVAAVADELAGNAIDAEDVLTTHDLRLAQIDRFIRSTPGDLAQVSPDSVIEFVVAFPNAPEHAPVVSASTMLLQTAPIDARGIEARNMVGRYLRLLSEFATIDINDARLQVLSQLAIYAERDALGGLADNNQMVARQGPSVLSDLRNDERFVAAVLQKSHVQVFLRQRLETILRVTDSVRVVLAGS